MWNRRSGGWHAVPFHRGLSRGDMFRRLSLGFLSAWWFNRWLGGLSWKFTPENRNELHVLSFFYKQTQTFFKPYLNAQANMVFRQNRPTRRGHEWSNKPRHTYLSLQTMRWSSLLSWLSSIDELMLSITSSNVQSTSDCSFQSWISSPEKNTWHANLHVIRQMTG